MHEQPHDPTDPAPEALSPRRAMLAGIGGLAAGAFLASTANAGPLNPPPGPIEPTMKRLDEVEPRIPVNTLSGSSNSVHRISLPGSYYLTGDIVGEPGKSGIQITASAAAGQIVIDLNGYRIRGVDGSFVGITVLGSSPRLVIRNGQINGWGWNGVNANCPMVLEDLRIEGNGQGQESHGGARGSDTVAAQVRRCVFVGNNGDGLRVGEGSVVENCTASANSRNGLWAFERSFIRDCHALNNGNTGIEVRDSSTVSRCNSQSNLRGITSGFFCTVSECIAQFNTFDGIEVNFSSTVSGCHASENSGHGIRLNNGSCTVLNCLVSRNTNSGIECDALYSTVRDNQCLDNSRGIHVSGSHTRLQGNNCMSNNDFGIRIFAPGCLTIQNTCGLNGTNYQLIGAYGPIASVASFGDMSNSPTDEHLHPWANFEY